MEQAKMSRELGLGTPKSNYEWEAGGTPPGDSAPGRWAVTKRAQNWVVLFYSNKGTEYVIHTFPLNEAGEKAAKTMAMKLVEIAWGKTAEAEKPEAKKAPA